MTLIAEAGFAPFVGQTILNRLHFLLHQYYLPAIFFHMFIIVIVRETVNADSPVSFEQGYFKILCIFL